MPNANATELITASWAPFVGPAAAAFSAPLAAPWPWMDFCARSTEAWLEWQRALWQPLIDGQADWLRQWQDQASWALPMLPMLPIRGPEQLA